MNNGFPRERASGSGGGPLSGSSPPSAFPESVEYASEYQGLFTPARDDSPQDAPRWQEVADAVWLAAYWDQHGGPAADGSGAGRQHNGGRTPARGDAPGKADPAPRPEEHADPDTPSAGLLSADSPDPAASTDASRPDDDTAPVRRPLDATADDTHAHRSTPDAADGAPGPAPVPADGELLPDPEGTAALHLTRPLLADDANQPQHGPGRRTAQLARALHQLQRRVSSRDTQELDEEATAEQGVADGLWLPFLRPVRTTAFDLVLLADDAPTMRIWEETVARLAEAAEHSGAFRSVRTVRVVLPRTGTPTLHWTSGGAVADPAELIDGRGGRVFLVVTDGLAHGWAASAADTLLGRLARSGPTALVHLLPPHLRHRSSLYPHPAVLEAGGFGVPNDALGHWAPPGGPDPMRPLPEAGDDSLPVPVLSLKPGSLAAWADLVTGERGVRRSLPVVLAGTLTKGAPAPGLRAPRF
ncbi:SAV_2336 family protein, partial [Streptomyces sp. 15-116A]|uniref:SAV_2336 N-terminal domain-related protein n=1 Tax=Streptomyces sp. 15-116A TaxID=2259035 RepID=UPI0021B22B50